MKKENFSLECPEGIEVTQDHNGLLITRQWASLPRAIFGLLFSIVWLGLAIYFICGPVVTGRTLAEIEPQELISAIPCLTIFVAAGIGSVYYALALFLNKTFIRVNSTTLSVKYSPLPFWPLWKNKEVQSSALAQLYCKESISHSGKGGKSVTYEVHAILKNSSSLKLLTYLTSDKQALFIEQEIENYLGIEDKRVPGELG